MRANPSQTVVDVAIDNARRDFLFYLQLVDPSYEVAPVHRVIASKLQEVASGKCKRLFLSMPPRHGKSRMAAIEFPAWLMSRRPGCEIQTASYASSLSNKHSFECQDRIRSAIHQEVFGVGLHPRRKAADDWMIANRSTYRATSVDGGATGMGADLFIIDDPFKGHAEAFSPAQRQKVWDWFLSDIYTRLSPGAAIIIIMTRWHTDDLVGRLQSPEFQSQLQSANEELDNEKWEELKFPGLAKKDDPLGREEGEALFPKRFPASRLRTIRRVLGSFKFGALYDQDPAPEGGNMINPAKFKILEKSPDGLEWVRFWDLATDEKQKSDFTSGIQVAVKRTPGKTKDEDSYALFLRWRRKGQWLWPRARTNIVTTAKRERVQVGVEAQGGFKTAYDNLREKMPQGIVTKAYTVDKSKVQRALPWIAVQEDGEAYLCKDGEDDWINDFMEQCRQFPNGNHDDDIDAVSGGWAMVTGRRRMMLA